MSKGKGFIAEFKAFIMRGNVIDLAVGVIIGGAFGAIVNSLVNDIIMPVISLLTKGIDFTSKFFAIDGKEYANLAAAQEAGAAVITYGNFIQALITFLIMAFVIFLVVKFINKLSSIGKEEVKEVPTTKECPFCKSEINIEAVRCPNCTSQLNE